MYPIKFEKVFIEKIWGGKLFSEKLGMELPDSKDYGESWEISTRENGESYIVNGSFKGKKLSSLIEERAEELLGKEIVDTYGSKFPLLVKYLDINDKLSVQVHPDNEYALREDGDMGKFESWYVVDASEDAKIILGTKAGMTRDEFEVKVRNQDFTDLFNEVSVKRGDIIDIAPGLVHASLVGNVLICEIQQNSDATYRIYDFDREVNGVRRELHIDRSLDVIDFDLKPAVLSIEDRFAIEIDSVFIEKLSSNEYYNIDKIRVENSKYFAEPYRNFKIHSIIEGSGNIIFNNENITVNRGDTVFIPSGLSYSIVGNVELLDTYI